MEKITPIADNHDATLAQLVINWTIHRPGVACVLVGARNAKQVNDNAQCMSISLTDEEMNAITNAADEFSLVEEKVV